MGYTMASGSQHKRQQAKKPRHQHQRTTAMLNAEYRGAKVRHCREESVEQRNVFTGNAFFHGIKVSGWQALAARRSCTKARYWLSGSSRVNANAARSVRSTRYARVGNNRVVPSQRAGASVAGTTTRHSRLCATVKVTALPVAAAGGNAGMGTGRQQNGTGRHEGRYEQGGGW